VIVDDSTRRRRPRRRADGTPEPRLTTSALESLLA